MGEARLATNKTLDPGSPEYAWMDRGQVIDSTPDKVDFNAIDPALVLDAAKHPWLAFGSYWGGIKMIRLADETGKPDRDDTEVRTLAARPKAKAVEAAYIIRHESFYYLFVSFDQCCKGVESSYKVMVGRAKEVTGPYVDFGGRPMTDGAGTLVLAGYANWRGPGHNSVLQTGGREWLVHHAYDAEHGGTPVLQVRPLLWQKNGWPVAGEPLEEWSPAEKKVAAEDLVGEWEHSAGGGEGFTVRLLEDGSVNDAQSGVKWLLADGVLTLHWADKKAPGGFWVDECLVGPGGQWYVGRNQTGAMIRGRKVEK